MFPTVSYARSVLSPVGPHTIVGFAHRVADGYVILDAGRVTARGQTRGMAAGVVRELMTL